MLDRTDHNKLAELANHRHGMGGNSPPSPIVLIVLVLGWVANRVQLRAIRRQNIEKQRLRIARHDAFYPSDEAIAKWRAEHPEITEEWEARHFREAASNSTMRLIASERRGKSGCVRRQSSTIARNSSDTLI